MRIHFTRKKVIIYAVGTGTGLVLGALYYNLIGCRTGTCPILSTAFRSTIYGGVLGFLVSGLFTGK